MDIEAVVGEYLRDDEDVAAIVGGRVSGRTPNSTQFPWVKITQIDQGVVEPDRALHQLMTHLQLDCYGGKDQALAHREASLLGRTVRQALHEMAGTYDDAVVTGVRFGGLPRVPDTSFEPTRERFALDAFVYAHPG